MTDRELVEQSLSELREQMDRHQQFVRTLVGVSRGEDRPTCVWPSCSHRRKLCKTLLDAIAVLEGTRRAFKSKQLEALRKQFVSVLEEEMQGR